MKIENKGKKYKLNFERSIELGVLVEEHREIKFDDLKTGDIVKWRNNGKGKWSWPYLIVQKGKSLINITLGLKEGYFGNTNVTSYAVLNKETGIYETLI